MSPERRLQQRLPDEGRRAFLHQTALALTRLAVQIRWQLGHSARYAAAGLKAVTALGELQRRVCRWRAFEGPEREVFFARQHEPGHLGLLDFTHASDLDVHIGGLRFEHLLYQSALAY